jgi:superfamily I DNA/RNA helicase
LEGEAAMEYFEANNIFKSFPEINIEFSFTAKKGSFTSIVGKSGSGKTTVLVKRIIEKITDENNPVDIDRILVLTYTDAAASEMRSRIEDAIENGEQIENDTEVITPVDAKTAIVEDKENGEFTKAVLDDDNIDMTAISEEEADKLTDGLAVEDTDEDEDDTGKPEDEVDGTVSESGHDDTDKDIQDGEQETVSIGHICERFLSHNITQRLDG